MSNALEVLTFGGEFNEFIAELQIIIPVLLIIIETAVQFSHVLVGGSYFFCLNK